MKQAVESWKWKRCYRVGWCMTLILIKNLKFLIDLIVGFAPPTASPVLYVPFYYVMLTLLHPIQL